MKRASHAWAVAIPLVLVVTTMAGCGVNKKESSAKPLAGTSTTRDVSDVMKKVSTGIYDLIGVKGRASDDQPFVMECEGKDDSKYFRIFHWWSFYPASATELDVAMDRLRENLPKHGWKIVHYGPDSSRQRNVKMAADNDRQKVGVDIVKKPKNNPPKLSMYVVSGCYSVPEGQEVEKF